MGHDGAGIVEVIGAAKLGADGQRIRHALHLARIQRRFREVDGKGPLLSAGVDESEAHGSCVCAHRRCRSVAPRTKQPNRGTVTEGTVLVVREEGVLMILFETDKRPMTYMLDQIEQGHSALPDCQRSFVWDANATGELLVSTIASYPARSLVLPQGGASLFGPREVEEAPNLVVQPPYIVLD